MAAKFKKFYEKLPTAEIGKYLACVIVRYESDKGTRLDYIVGPFTADEKAQDWMTDHRARARPLGVTFELALMVSPSDPES